MEKISIEEFGKRIGIGRAMAYRWSKAGKIKLDRVKVGRQTFYYFKNEKVSRSLVSFDDPVRKELLRMRKSLADELKRLDLILSVLTKPDLLRARRLIRNQRNNLTK